jgi:hypothetical protein
MSVRYCRRSCLYLDIVPAAPVAQQGEILVPYMCFRWMLVSGLALTNTFNASSSQGGSAIPTAARPEARSDHNKANGTWSPVVTLRDTSDTFRKGPDRVGRWNRHVIIYGGIGRAPNDETNYAPGITFLSLDENVPEHEGRKTFDKEIAPAPADGKRYPVVVL